MSHNKNDEYSFDPYTRKLKEMGKWSVMFDNCYGDEAERVVHTTQHLSHRRRRDATHARLLT